MTEKDMKKLTRYQLLELLIIQSEQVKDLQKKLEEAQKELDDQEIQMAVVGSIAEASMQLGGIFEAAQRTADIYLKAVKERVALIEEHANREAERILMEAKRKASMLLEDAENWPGMDEMLRTYENGTEQV